MQPANEEAGCSLKVEKKAKIKNKKIILADKKKVHTFAVPKQTGLFNREKTGSDSWFIDKKIDRESDR